MFTPQELQALLELTNRVTIQGAEAEGVVMLRQKIRGLLESKPKEAEPKPE